MAHLEVFLLDNTVPVVVIAPGFHGHAIARSLGRLGVPVYGVHADKHSPAARSRYWRENFVWNIEKKSPEASIDWLLQLSQKIGSRPILLPTDDHSCVFLADHVETLKEAFLFPNQPAGLTRALSNKQEKALDPYARNGLPQVQGRRGRVSRRGHVPHHAQGH